MGGKYVGSPKCGCALPKIQLEIKHESMFNTDNPTFKAGRVGFHGIANFRVNLVPMQGMEGRYSGDTTVVRSMQAQIVNKACTGTASQTEHWWFSAEVDQTSGAMELTFGFTASDFSGSSECKVGGHVIRNPLDPYLFHDLNKIVLPADSGATKEETLKEPHGTAQEWLVVKVIAVPGR